MEGGALVVVPYVAELFVVTGANTSDVARQFVGLFFMLVEVRLYRATATL